MNTKTVKMLYGRDGMELRVPENASVLRSAHPQPLDNPRETVRAGLERPIGCPSLRELVKKKRPKTVAITISDITRPVPNKTILPELLRVLNEEGVADAQVTIVVGTGMHRPSTPEEKIELVGTDVLRRVRIVDHRADDPSTVVRVSDDPPVSVNKIFVQADFRIVTGLIEPHFMAGYSGGRKGICPALVDLNTVQRFHGHKVMGDARSTSGLLEGNPCHAESLRVARKVGCDFLVNVAVDGHREVAGVYAGEMEAAHAAGIRDVERWTIAFIDKPFDLVVTSGGGYPLDQTYYQTGKGVVTALDACHEKSTILIVADCREGVGSDSFTEMMFEWCGRWREFLRHIAGTPVKKDQWQVQMLCRAASLVGDAGVRLVSELPPETVRKCWIVPVEGAGTPQQRAQRALDEWVAGNPAGRIAVVPEGPYTMLRVARK